MQDSGIHHYNLPERDTTIIWFRIMSADPEILSELCKTEMPFGRYRGTLLSNLPVSYLEWFYRQGFPEGRLGMMLNTIYEIKINGLEFLLDRFRKGAGNYK